VYKLKYTDLLDRFDKLPVPRQTIPTLPVVKGALTRLHRLQEKMGASLLEWHSKDEVLYILEPSFLFYLRWRKHRTTSPTIVDVFKDLLSNIEIKVAKGGGITVTILEDTERPPQS
jgi:hypothetical protein